MQAVCVKPALSSSLGVMCVKVLPPPSKVIRGFEDHSESFSRILGNLFLCVMCVWGCCVWVLHVHMCMWWTEIWFPPENSPAGHGVPGARPESSRSAPMEIMWGISLEQSLVKATLDQWCVDKCLTSFLWVEEALHCLSTCEFLWCNYSHYGWFPATSRMSLHAEVGSDAHGELLWASLIWLQHDTHTL